ncbi:unnamed protein product [Adineta steineri]|uniref:BRCT domain-containing protein n=1 Tax=Adineta steineri TaxID=433720 RepID=A0A815RZI2_9BILA|nr:unnamed protein product [Adineta steineri]CAF1484023.1 unnamed protein product [Adineta steineri]
MSEEIQSLSIENKFPLQGVVIFVSQQLTKNRTTLHQQCTELGGKFVWVFDVPFTHYICQGKLSKRGKEYKKVEEYRATCVHPAWLKACQKFGQRVAEKLYATTYNPNRSLNFVSEDDDDDEDEENHVPSLTTMKPVITLKRVQTSRIIPIIDKKQKSHIVTSIPTTQLLSSSSQVIPSSSKPLSQISNEAETMLNDLESSLAQFLTNNSNTSTIMSRSIINDDEQNRKSIQIIRSISNITDDNIHTDIEQSMRVEWLDDAMQAERKKMIDEDENGTSSQQQIQSGEAQIRQKRPLVDSNFDHSFNKKKCRI